MKLFNTLKYRDMIMYFLIVFTNVKTPGNYFSECNCNLLDILQM